MLLHLQDALRQPLFWGVLVVAYLLGSIPFGLLFAKWIKGIDLRTIGSGNIGASNAGRALGRGWAIAVFFCDFFKGFGPVLTLYVMDVDEALLPMMQLAAGTAAVLGHCYSIYLRFEGGKAVATGCGAIVAVSPLVFVAGGLVWLLTRRVTRYNGLASILMSLSWPVTAWCLDAFLLSLSWPITAWRLDRHKPEFVLGMTFLAVLILVRHRSNIQRMLAGTEPRAGEKDVATPAARSHG